MRLTLIMDHGLPTERTIMAPVPPSAIKSYLDSYGAFHDRLTVFSENDKERSEGLSAEEWLTEYHTRQ